MERFQLAGLMRRKKIQERKKKLSIWAKKANALRQGMFF